MSGQVAVASALDVVKVRDAVENHFPGLWPAVEVGLSVCATLLLADNVNPVAVIYVGGPSSSKTTVADLFAGHARCYRSDNFTPAAFVSHAANRSSKTLEKVDLLPRIRHKVLVTPELAPIFRGKEDDLTREFAIITRVMDGQGLTTDSGTHGQRGYVGDYLFTWLGCTTPFDPKVWRVMAQLGSRLFFLLMDAETEVSVEGLLAALDAVPYKERHEMCKGALHKFLTALFEKWNGVRGVKWAADEDPQPVKEWIARFAMLLAAMRSEPVREGDPKGEGAGYVPPKRELPYRALAVLLNLARGHALVHDRQQLTEHDLPILARIVVSSMPTECALVFKALVRHGEKRLTVAEAQRVLGAKHHETARKVLEELGKREIMEREGKVYHLRLRAGWEWCASPEFVAFIGG